ncbi:hypothetical protein B5E65_01985 [Gemmiger sp. An120]|uniref:zinc-ribbon domain-containing protein n=1 Tax=Gemmiger sp. An120 TaxID=1965549 RepID=UPI000B3A85DF|nr:zinc-ribbon domain-containing protein [Gemmiger sp. An120]OUQ43772.1 hypothetical protein B5E65_01985 [Gemmiger sp. An120]
MFCKYCGRDIPETAEFCPACGKKLKEEIFKDEEERKPLGAVFVLMLLVLCGSTVVDWGRVLLLGYQLHIGLVIPTVMLVAGLALLGILIGQEKISTADYRLSDLLVLLCVRMVVPGLLLRWEFQLASSFGTDAVSAYGITQTVIMPTIQFPAFWLALGLIVLGLGRRRNWQPAKKQKRILLVVLGLCSILGFLFVPQLAMVNGVPIEMMAIVVQMTRLWCILCWLWPLVVLQVFHWLGTDKVGPVGAGAALVGIQLGKFFLLPIILFRFKLGPTGFGLTEGISPLFGLLFLCIATRLHKKKQG